MTIPLSTFNHCLRIVGPRSIGLFAHAFVTGRPREVKVAIEHSQFPVTLRIGTTDVGTYKQIFVTKEYDWDLASDPRCIVDAGANIGLTSVFFANRYPNATIYSIEPESSNFDLLRRNTSPYPNIIPIHAALWNEDSIINLVDPGLGEWGFQTRNNQPTESDEQVRHGVAAMTLNQLMADNNIDNIDLLKIDIEGAEVEVLEAAEQWIENVSTVMVELHERFRPGCEAAFSNATAAFDLHHERGPIAFASRAA